MNMYSSDKIQFKRQVVGLSRATHKTVILETEELRESKYLQGTLLADKGMVMDKNPLAEYATDQQFQGEILAVNII